MSITKRDFFATLSKPELLDIGRRVEVEVTGKMSKEELLDRLGPSDRADLTKILPGVAYESLKAACKDLGLVVGGRDKAAMVTAVLAAVTPAGMPVPQAAPRAPADYTLELDVEPRKPRLAWQGMDRKEAVVSVPAQVVEIVRPGRARDRGDSLLNTDLKTHARGAGERDTNELPPNRLIWTNDNLVALQTLLDERDPVTHDYRYRGKVDLIYIDPPFMVNSDFRADNTIDIEIDEDEGVQAKKEPSLVEHLAYRDTWRQGLDSFLSMLKRRLELLKELLARTGTIYVHLDWHAVHYVKVLMDEIFGYESFVNEIVWKRGFSHNDLAQGAKHMGRVHDTLLMYAGSADFHINPVFLPYEANVVRDWYNNVDSSGRRFQYTAIVGPGGAAKGNPFYELMGHKKYWRYSEENARELVRQGRIVQPSPGAIPRFKRYLDEMPGVSLQDLWTDLSPVNSQAIEAVGYPTQKPLPLLERVIHLSSPSGGLVLDCFVGSGSTIEAAERLGRRWIGIDNGKYAIHLARKRLIQLDGQPKTAEKVHYDFVECTSCRNIERGFRSSLSA